MRLQKSTRLLLIAAVTLSVAAFSSYEPQRARVQLVRSVAQARSQGGPACGVPNEFANTYRDYVVEVDTATDSSRVELRQAWQIPAVSVSDIAFETDSLRCSRAAVSYALSGGRDTTNAAGVWLLRVGPTRYIAFNGERAGEFFIYVVLDSAFNYLETI